MSIRLAILAGLLGGLCLGLTQALLRFAGLPLPSELVADRVLPLLPVQAFIFVTGHLGGPISAKRQALLGGFAGSLLAGAAAGLVYSLLLRRRWPSRHSRLTLLMGLVVVWLGALLLLGPVLQSSYLGLPPAQAAAVTAAGLLFEFVIFALVLYLAVRPTVRHTLDRPAPPSESGRRGFLIGLGGLIVALAAGGLVSVLYRRSTLGYDGLSLDGAVERITPTDKFYVVTKNLIDPQVEGRAWRLEVTGRVSHPMTYDLDQLTSLPGAVDQETTLECISNEVGKGLLSNAVWRGVPLRDLLAPAGVLPGVVGVSFRAVDGYTHGVELTTAMDPKTLVAWAMNGMPLTDRHGYPARLLVPSAYGELSVKWLTRIELVDHTQQGYYESQGWQATFVQTTSRIDVPSADQVLRAGQRVAMRGVAYAADRGVSRVEVSTDGGSTWSTARIDSGGPGTWSLWSLEWTPSGGGPRQLRVRAYDGGGQLQKETHRPSVPAGAAGEFMVPVMVTP